ncbi:MAG TPA: C-type lectin domain-containing protein [Polyangiaceae bacterium]|nr:C-type lectin domain-containing protein [Polyangiaceae bacterium]
MRRARPAALSNSAALFGVRLALALALSRPLAQAAAEAAGAGCGPGSAADSDASGVAEGSGSAGAWIGGSDLNPSGTFSWLEGSAFFADGAAVPGVYQNFASDQPAKTAGLDCVQLHDDPTGPWSNARCADAKQFICERR